MISIEYALQRTRETRDRFDETSLEKNSPLIEESRAARARGAPLGA